MQVQPLYIGSRSANGVILIESKKGTGVNGKPKFELRTSYGSISQLKPLEVYGAQGYMQRLNDILNDNGTVVPMDQTPNYLQTNEKVNYNATPDHKPTLEDPYSLFSQTGYNFNTSLSVSQRTDKMSYFLSGNYTDQKGVILYDRFKHYSVRLNLESKITNWLTIGVRSFYSNRSYPDSRMYGAASNGSSTYLFSPYADVYNADGSYNMFPQTTTSFVNPFSMMANEAYNRTGNLNGIGYATIKVPWVKGLSYTATYSKTQNTSMKQDPFMDSIPTRDKVLRVRVQEPIQEVRPLCLTTLSSITEPLLKSTTLILPYCILIKNLKPMVNRFLLPVLTMISLVLTAYLQELSRQFQPQVLKHKVLVRWHVLLILMMVSIRLQVRSAMMVIQLSLTTTNMAISPL